MSEGKFNDKTPINSEGAECPYCGNVQYDMHEILSGDGDCETIDCECGNKFQVEMCVTVDFRSSPLKCTEHKYSKYDWSKWSIDIKRDWEDEHPPKGQHSRYRQCVNCDEGYEHQKQVLEPCDGDNHQWEDEYTFWFPNEHSTNKENSWRVRHCKFHGREAKDYDRKNFTDEEIEKMKIDGDYYAK